jgi:hypothetical protein
MIVGKNIGRIILDDLSKVASRVDKLSEAIHISDGLEKVASFSLNESTEFSVREMIKTASSCIKDLVGVINSMNKEASVKSLVGSMVDRGMIDSESFQEKVAELMKKDDRELSIIKEATQLYNRNSFSLFEKQASCAINNDRKPGMFASVMEG